MRCSEHDMHECSLTVAIYGHWVFRVHHSISISVESWETMDKRLVPKLPDLKH